MARWGSGGNVALAAHGITASSMAWRGVARHLDDDWSLIAPDFRGRGDSRALAGPFGLEANSDDLLAVAERLDIDRAVLAGHSMGAYVVALAAARAPALAQRVVMVDGGLPPPRPERDVDVDAVLEATLGPARARLRMVFAGPEEYVDFWRRHPALAAWNDDIEAYVRYDLTGAPGAMRAKASEAAVTEDGRGIFLGEPTIGAALRSIKCPMTLLRAPRGLLDEPGGFQPEALVERWRDELADFHDVLVEDTNHYTIQLGERGAAVVAASIAGRSAPPSG